MTTAQIPLTPPQRDMIMMERLRPGSTNITFGIAVPDVSLSEIEAAVATIVARHDVLRMKLVRGTSEVTISEDRHAEIVVSDDARDVAELARKSIALDADEPNLRVVVDDSARSTRLQVSIPHSMTDGCTTILLYEELQRLFHEPSQRGGAEPPAAAGFSAFAAELCEMYDNPSTSVLEFWEEQLGGLEPLAKKLFLEQPDPGYVDIPIGPPQTLRRIQQRLEVTESVALISLFALGLGSMLDGQPVACRTAFVGRRSRQQMEVVGPFFELPVLMLDAMTSDFVERRIQASVLQLLVAPQPRDVLVKRLSRSVRGALSRQVCIFQDNRHFFSGKHRQVFAADNRRLYRGEYEPGSRGDELAFVPVDDVKLLGVDYPVRGEVISSEDDQLIYLRVLTSTIDRQRVLDAAVAIEDRLNDLASIERPRRGRRSTSRAGSRPSSDP